MQRNPRHAFTCGLLVGIFSGVCLGVLCTGIAGCTPTPHNEQGRHSFWTETQAVAPAPGTTIGHHHVRPVAEPLQPR